MTELKQTADAPAPGTGDDVCMDLFEDCRDIRLETEAGKLTPHFLLNSLQAVAVLLETHRTSEARNAVSRLTDLLRRQLDTDLTGEQPLGEQVEFVRDYLQIERLRHEGDLELEVRLDASAERALVPTRLLQPLVENAARHGLAGRTGTGRVEIRAEREGRRLVVLVRDNGRGLPEDWSVTADAGTGLRALRASLCRLHEDRHRLEVENRAGEAGTRVQVEVPYRAA